MKLRLLVVGKGAKDLSAFEARFLERLQPFAPCQVIELPEGRGKQISQRKQQEANEILKRAKQGFILFDERGRSLASTQWRDHLAGFAGNSEQDFVIGGANGVSDAVRNKAGACWSLSRLTLPHQLARVLVLEQLYRAISMIQGHPYHRA